MKNTVRALLVSSVIFMQLACSLGGPTRPSSFYVLNTEPGTPVNGSASHSVGVGPVVMPGLFDRPQIVTRPDTNTIDMDEFNRWGSDLNREVVRVLTQNLMNRLDTDNVVSSPWQRRDNPDLQVTVRFFRFDGVVDESVEVAGIWQILDGNRGCQLAIERFEYSMAPTAPGYAGFVNTLSDGLGQLSQSIAQALTTVKSGCEAR